jgi:hypothetical protein
LVVKSQVQSLPSLQPVATTTRPGNADSAVDLSIFGASGDLLSTAGDTAKLLRGIVAGRSPIRGEPRADDGDFRPLVNRPIDYGHGTFRLAAFTRRRSVTPAKGQL